jgi:copper chaperone NosL
MSTGVDAARRDGWALRLSRRQALGGLVAMLGGLVAACGAADDPSQPPTIRYGLESCAACGMIISEPAYAAAYRTTGGEVRLFDDMGEMVRYHRRQREAVQSFFVHDFERQTWLRAEEGVYVVSHGLRTPMGTGMVALASEAEARALADRVGGRVLRWSEVELQAAPLRTQPVPPPAGGPPTAQHDRHS